MNHLYDRLMPKFDRETFEYPKPTDDKLYDQKIYHSIFGINTNDLVDQRVAQFRPAFYTQTVERPFIPKREAKDLTELMRRVSNIKPDKILDAPELEKDFNLNLLSYEANFMAVGLGNLVYRYNEQSKEISSIEGENFNVTAVEFIDKRAYTALAREGGAIEVWSNREDKQLRRIQNASRVNKLLYSHFQPGILFAGNSLGSVSALDVRIQNPIIWENQSNNEGQICGLAESNHLLASSSSVVKIWDVRRHDRPITQLPHNTLVRAMAWHPVNSSLMATGGGMSDRQIRIWDAHTGLLKSSIDTLSQVCNIFWNATGDQLVSTHGLHEEENFIKVWYCDKNMNITLLGDVKGHTARATQAVMDGNTLVTAGDDETLRFWPIWNSEAPPIQTAPPPFQSSIRTSIR